MKLSDEYLMTVINKLDGIGEVPWLIQKEMARELLEWREGKIGFWGNAAGKLANDKNKLKERLAAAEKVVESVQWHLDNKLINYTPQLIERMKAYAKVVKKNE